MSEKEYAIVTVPTAPVRVKPNHKLEMSNQLLFGEAVKILKKKDDNWIKVESLYDGYVGWLTHHLITRVDADVAVRPCTLLAPKFLNSIQFKEQVMQIPLGSSLPGLKNKKGIIGGFSYSYNGKPINTQAITDKSAILIANAMQWLNAPYMWGGKTLLGVDCSGFCQTMYKLIGIQLCRDAWQQATQGLPVKSLKEALPCDLAFFEETDKIAHVGILLGSNKIIHAAGKVRIDKIDKKGIINTDTGIRTHRLKIIKRYI